MGLGQVKSLLTSQWKVSQKKTLQPKRSTIVINEGSVLARELTCVVKKIHPIVTLALGQETLRTSIKLGKIVDHLGYGGIRIRNCLQVKKIQVLRTLVVGSKRK